LCAVIPVLAVVTHQRLWVKLAAPVVFGLIAYLVSHTYSTSYTEWVVATRDSLTSTIGARR